MNRAMTMTAALAALLVVAGCSKQQPAENVTENAGAEQAPLPAPTPAPEPQAEAPIAKPAPPAAEPVAPEAQILDDADATGMTARLSRGGEDEPANNTAPAGNL